jgi:hypothetical protein
MSVLHCPVCRTVVELNPDGFWQIDVEINRAATECSIAMNDVEVHLCYSHGGGGSMVREPRRPLPPSPRLAEGFGDEWLSSLLDE